MMNNFPNKPLVSYHCKEKTKFHQELLELVLWIAADLLLGENVFSLEAIILLE